MIQSATRPVRARRLLIAALFIAMLSLTVLGAGASQTQAASNQTLPPCPTNGTLPGTIAPPNCEYVVYLPIVFGEPYKIYFPLVFRAEEIDNGTLPNSVQLTH